VSQRGWIFSLFSTSSVLISVCWASLLGGIWFYLLKSLENWNVFTKEELFQTLALCGGFQFHSFILLDLLDFSRVSQQLTSETGIEREKWAVEGPIIEFLWVAEFLWVSLSFIGNLFCESPPWSGIFSWFYSWKMTENREFPGFSSEIQFSNVEYF